MIYDQLPHRGPHGDGVSGRATCIDDAPYSALAPTGDKRSEVEFVQAPVLAYKAKPSCRAESAARRLAFVEPRASAERDMSKTAVGRKRVALTLGAVVGGIFMEE